MQHTVSLKCARFRLRPVTLEDAAFIVDLRSDPILNRFIHEISYRVEDQIAWLEKYFMRADDYYFVVEDADSRIPQGTIAIYDVAENRAGAEWGRWILKRGSLAALESAWLIYEVGFTRLGLASLWSRTLTDNPKVLSFHDSFGATRVATLERHFLIRGILKSAIEHRVEATGWPAIRTRHYSMALRLNRRPAIGSGIEGH